MLLKEEKDYYESYRWALMPFLSFRQLTEKLRGLLEEDLESKPDWCKREWNLNLSMLSSAALDLVDDYLVRGVIDLSELSEHFSFMAKPVRWVRGASRLRCKMMGALSDRRIQAWQRAWSEWVVSVSLPLVINRAVDSNDQRAFRDQVMPLLAHPFPKRLVAMRMRIPAAYRSQDLTHHDFVALSKKFLAKGRHRGLPLFIVGLRTAGSYIAPLVCAHLRHEGYERVSFVTLRPKGFVHPLDEARLTKAVRSDAYFILVDEPPSTGKAVSRAAEILRQLGAQSQRISILVPIHPAGRTWLDPALKHAFGNSDIITLPPEEWYKEKLLQGKDLEAFVTPYARTLGVDPLGIAEDRYVQELNDELGQNPDKAYHKRLKRVFKIVPDSESKIRGDIWIFAKSVGWGWLGYHAALAAESLPEYVPNTYGVRNGIVLMDWVKERGTGDKGKEIQGDIAKRLSDYIGKRTNTLRLNENPTPFLNDYMEGGMQPIIGLLSKAFGPKVKNLKRGWIRKQLEKMPCPVPTFLDSRMMRVEWVGSKEKMLKTDFEHHGFSKTASYNIVDPAYDLASSMLEFELGGKERQDLVTNYIQATGDTSVARRLFYYELLAGSETMKESLRMLNKLEYSPIYFELNRKYVSAWNHLVSESMHYAARLCEGEPIRSWGEPMFVMDIDDVLDKNIFGFPTTTANGIYALSLLRAHGTCSVINTARSLQEVKDCCKHYGFSGGIAEYGSVFWDDVDGKLEVLVPEVAMEELIRLKEALSKVPGIFLNPSYRYSIRAYSFDSERTIPVPDAAMGELFQRLGIKHLKTKKSYIDTAILAHSVDKGRGLLRLKEMKGAYQGKMAAIGDSEADLPMLLVADQGYLVGNSGIDLRQKARKFGISITRSSFQTGLLKCVYIFLHGDSKKRCERCRWVERKLEGKKDLFWRILENADLSRRKQWLRAFDRNSFEIFRRLNQ